MAAPATTSMQVALESPRVKEGSDAYVRALSHIVESKSDVVGYAYAINGKLNSADAYASHDLFQRMWPKMLQASAAEALAERQGKTASAPDTAAVKTFLADGDRAPQKSNDGTGRITVTKQDSGKVVLFEATDREMQGRWLHKSYVMK
jgi:hypothetical protein